MILKLSYIYTISFVLTFLPMFVVYIKKGSNGNIYIGLLTTILTYLLFIILKNKYFQKSLVILLKNTIIKSYLFYIGYVLLALLFHIILGHYKANVSFYAVRIYKFYFAAILIYLLPFIGIMIGIKFRKLLKLFILILWILFIISIIQYFAFVFNITFLISIIDFFSNARAALYIDSTTVQTGLRAYAFFSEPSGLGQFIFIIMPFVILISKCKEKIFKNILFDKFVKKSFLPFMILTLIFTKSPIYLVFCFIELFILLLINYWNKIKKYFSLILFFIIILFFISFIIFITYQNQIEQTFLFRIIKTIYSFGDFDKLVILEPSLATRIYSYSIQLVAFTKAFIFGCGLNNAEVFVNPFYLSESLLPPTAENFYLGFLHTQNLCGLNRSVVYTSLAEFGIVGFSLYIIFWIKNLKVLKSLKKYFQGFEYSFLIALIQSFITIMIISFYNLGLDNAIIWLIFGYSLVFMYINKKRKGNKIV